MLIKDCQVVRVVEELLKAGTLGARLSHHLVRLQEEQSRDREPEGLGGLEVED